MPAILLRMTWLKIDLPPVIRRPRSRSNSPNSRVQRRGENEAVVPLTVKNPTRIYSKSQDPTLGIRAVTEGTSHQHRLLCYALAAFRGPESSENHTVEGAMRIDALFLEDDPQYVDTVLRVFVSQT